MTEALAGLSIAVNVMQVIAFSRDTILTIKRLYDNKPLVSGATEDSQSFSELITALREHRTHTCKPSQQDKALSMVAEQALEVAEQIKGISQDYQAVLGASKTKRLVRGLGKALKYNLLDKSKVKDLEFTLSKLQNLMLSHILVDLRQHVKAGKIIESAELHNLEHKVQHFTRRLEAGISEMEHFLGHGPKSSQVKAVTVPGTINSSNVREAIDSSDTSARFIGSAGPASHMLAFARVLQDVRGIESNENCPGQVAVLYDMDYSHFLRFIFRKSLPKEIDNMEGCHFMKDTIRPKHLFPTQGNHARTSEYPGEKSHKLIRQTDRRTTLRLYTRALNVETTCNVVPV